MSSQCNGVWTESLYYYIEPHYEGREWSLTNALFQEYGYGARGKGGKNCSNQTVVVSTFLIEMWYSYISHLQCLGFRAVTCTRFGMSLVGAEFPLDRWKGDKVKKETYSSK